MKNFGIRFVSGALVLGACVHASAQKMSARAPQAFSQEEVALMMENFSERRPVFTQIGGEKLYQAICQGCHMPQGQGARGIGFYPALTSNPRLAAAAYPVAVVMNGLHGMPGFAGRLSDEQIAAAVNFVRSNFGNQYPDTVSAADVKFFRKPQQ